MQSNWHSNKKKQQNSSSSQNNNQQNSQTNQQALAQNNQQQASQQNNANVDDQKSDEEKRKEEMEAERRRRRLRMDLVIEDTRDIPEEVEEVDDGRIQNKKYCYRSATDVPDNCFREKTLSITSVSSITTW